MSEDSNVVPMRAHREPPGFQSALKKWRRLAHSKDLVVASPVRLVGAERTFFGDSDDEGFGPKDYKISDAEALFGVGSEIWLSEKERKMLELIAPVLLEMEEIDIKDCRAPSKSRVPEQEDERLRWEVLVTPSHRVGTVIRIGDGAKKHYHLWLWDGGWYRVSGQPSFDLPMFGLPELRARPEAPVMIHEGPKSWQGAQRAGRGDFECARLGNWMSLYAHVAWHGSDAGMDWTDWSPLRGRRVLIWPDMDEPGLLNARALARKIALMGGVVEYVSWGREDIERNENWDWGDADEGRAACPSQILTRTEVRERIKMIESPVNARGQITDEWAKRSFYDAERGEVREYASGYAPLPLAAYRLQHGPKVATAIAQSSVNEFRGTDFRAGLPYGRMKNGKINLCPPNLREPAKAAPLPRDLFEELVRRWLAKMVPDVQQRKHLIRRAAWAVARPEKVPQHMIVMQGESGLGKSVFLDLIVEVAGHDRAISLFPDTIMSRFNALLANRSVVCIHEIHSDDLTRKQNASRLKELVANQDIAFEEKNRPKTVHTNVIHWFAATNERVPFALEHGNDRFYFIKCVSPQTPKDARRKDAFFREWVSKFKDPMLLDMFYRAAKWLASSMTEERIQTMTDRARRQAVWEYLRTSSMRPWEQFLFARLNDLADQDRPTETPLAFIAAHVVDLVRENYNAGEDDIKHKMREFGYTALRYPDGKNAVQRRTKGGRKLPVWVWGADVPTIYKKYGRDFGKIEVQSLIVDSVVDGS